MRWAIVVALAGCGRVDFVTQSDAQSVGFCAGLAPPPVFCSDFDGPDVWGETSTDHGDLALVAMAMSPPNALLVTTDALDVTTTAAVYRRISALGQTQRATIAFDVRVETIGQSDPIIA